MSSIAIVGCRNAIHQVKQIGVFKRYQLPALPCNSEFIVVLVVACHIKLPIGIIVLAELKQYSTFVGIGFSVNQAIEVNVFAHGAQWVGGFSVG